MAPSGFAADPLACVITTGIDASFRFLRAFHALTINDGGGRRRGRLRAFNIERSLERAVEAPQSKDRKPYWSDRYTRIGIST
jgi:hypothetical protein